MRMKPRSGLIYDFKELLTNPTSCVRVERKVRHIAIFPNSFGRIKKAVDETLESYLNKFDKEFKGFILDFKNVTILTDRATIIDDRCPIHFDIEADFYLFTPEIGSRITGIVNKKSLNHVGCLVHKFFNVSLPRPSEENDEWIGASVNIGDEVTLTVDLCDFTGSIPYIRGKLTNVRSANVTPLVEDKVDDSSEPIKKKKKKKHKDSDQSLDGAENDLFVEHLEHKVKELPESRLEKKGKRPLESEEEEGREKKKRRKVLDNQDLSEFKELDFNNLTSDDVEYDNVLEDLKETYLDEEGGSDLKKHKKKKKQKLCTHKNDELLDELIEYLEHHETKGEDVTQCLAPAQKTKKRKTRDKGDAETVHKEHAKHMGESHISDSDFKHSDGHNPTQSSVSPWIGVYESDSSESDLNPDAKKTSKKHNVHPSPMQRLDVQTSIPEDDISFEHPKTKKKSRKHKLHDFESSDTQNTTGTSISLDTSLEHHDSSLLTSSLNVQEDEHDIRTENLRIKKKKHKKHKPHDVESSNKSEISVSNDTSPGHHDYSLLLHNSNVKEGESDVNDEHSKKTKKKHKKHKLQDVESFDVKNESGLSVSSDRPLSHDDNSQLMCNLDEQEGCLEIGDKHSKTKKKKSKKHKLPKVELFDVPNKSEMSISLDTSSLHHDNSLVPQRTVVQESETNIRNEHAKKSKKKSKDRKLLHEDSSDLQNKSGVPVSLDTSSGCHDKSLLKYSSLEESDHDIDQHQQTKKKRKLSDMQPSVMCNKSQTSVVTSLEHHDNSTPVQCSDVQASLQEVDPKAEYQPSKATKKKSNKHKLQTTEPFDVQNKPESRVNSPAVYSQDIKASFQENDSDVEDKRRKNKIKKHMKHQLQHYTESLGVKNKSEKSASLYKAESHDKSKPIHGLEMQTSLKGDQSGNQNIKSDNSHNENVKGDSSKNHVSTVQEESSIIHKKPTGEVSSDLIKNTALPGSVASVEQLLNRAKNRMKLQSSKKDKRSKKKQSKMLTENTDTIKTSKQLLHTDHEKEMKQTSKEGNKVTTSQDSSKSHIVNCETSNEQQQDNPKQHVGSVRSHVDMSSEERKYKSDSDISTSGSVENKAKFVIKEESNVTNKHKTKKSKSKSAGLYEPDSFLEKYMSKFNKTENSNSIDLPHRTGESENKVGNKLEGIAFSCPSLNSPYFKKGANIVNFVDLKHKKGNESKSDASPSRKSLPLLIAHNFENEAVDPSSLGANSPESFSRNMILQSASPEKSQTDVSMSPDIIKKFKKSSPTHTNLNSASTKEVSSHHLTQSVKSPTKNPGILCVEQKTEVTPSDKLQQSTLNDHSRALSHKSSKKKKKVHKAAVVTNIENELEKLRFLSVNSSAPNIDIVPTNLVTTDSMKTNDMTVGGTHNVKKKKSKAKLDKKKKQKERKGVKDDGDTKVTIDKKELKHKKPERREGQDGQKGNANSLDDLKSFSSELIKNFMQLQK